MEKLQTIPREDLLHSLLLASKIGDGCFVLNGQNYYLNIVNKQKDFILFKQSILNEFLNPNKTLKKLPSGYKEGAYSYTFSTKTCKKVSEYALKDRKEVITTLSKTALILYYLDDGSRHKSKNFIHIYCNMFSDDEAELLIDKIQEYYPGKKCALRKDIKKDGRSFNYLYMPVSISKQFLLDVKEFVINNNIPSMLYKGHP